MTVDTTTSKDTYAGNDVTTVFTVNFRILDQAHIAVTLIDDTTSVETLQVITTDYTVSGVGDPTASVTMIVAPASGETLAILRDVPLTQTRDYVTGDKFPADSHEDALDKLTMAAQEQAELLDRTLTMGTTFSGIPVKVADPTANTVLQWSAAGDAIVTGVDASTFDADVLAAAASAAAAAVSETNAGASETASAASASNASTSETNAATSETNAATSATEALNSVGLGYTFSTTTADADPGSGILRFNNATPASVTSIFIDNLDGQGADVSAFLDTWDDASTTNASVLVLRSITTPSEVIIFNITAVVDSTGYRTLTVVHVSGTILFGNTDDLSLQNSRSGDLGGTAANTTVADVNNKLDGTNVEDALTELAEYTTVALMLASTETARGEDSVWRATGYRYLEAAPAATDEHLTTAGGVKLYVQPDFVGYVANAFSSTFDEAAAQLAFDAVVADTSEDRIVFQNSWTINSVVTISDPQDLTITAWGATFTTPNDILMFDLNGRADPTYVDNESRQNFKWFGGIFFCTFTTPLKATAFRMLGMRKAELYPEHITGFFDCISMGGKDTITVGNFKGFDNDKLIIVPPWSVVGGPIIIRFPNIHGSLSTKTGHFLKSYLPLGDCIINNYSLNMGTGSDVQGCISVTKQLIFGVASVTGTFTVGETITGGTSGATADYLETYEHPFAFQIAQNTTYLVCENRSGTFVVGETLTGGTSGATSATDANASYLIQNVPWNSFTIEAPGHTESGSSASGSKAILLRDIEGVGNIPTSFNIDVGTSGNNGGGSVGVEYQRIDSCVTKGRFAQTAGLGTPIKYDALCTNMKVAKPAFFSTGVIDLNGMDRQELDLQDWNEILDRTIGITNLTAKVFTVTTAKTTVDMSVDFSGFNDRLVGGLAPKAWGLQVGMAAVTSNTATQCRFRCYNPAEAAFANIDSMEISNLRNNSVHKRHFLVGADDNGDWSYDANLVASGDLTVSVFVIAAYH